MAAERRESHGHQCPEQHQATERGQAQFHPAPRKQARQQIAQHGAHPDHQQHQAGDGAGPHPARLHFVGDLRNEEGHVTAHRVEKTNPHCRTPERPVAPHLHHVREVVHPEAPAEWLGRLGLGGLSHLEKGPRHHRQSREDPGHLEPGLPDIISRPQPMGKQLTAGKRTHQDRRDVQHLHVADKTGQLGLTDVFEQNAALGRREHRRLHRQQKETNHRAPVGPQPQGRHQQSHHHDLGHEHPADHRTLGKPVGQPPADRPEHHVGQNEQRRDQRHHRLRILPRRARHLLRQRNQHELRRAVVEGFLGLRQKQCGQRSTG